jgi:hypothetical protein
MWECDWLSIMDNIHDTDRAKLEGQAEDENINIRDAMAVGLEFLILRVMLMIMVKGFYSI